MQADNNDRVEPTLTDVIKEFKALETKVDAFNQRFADYQKAMQWVVNMAFALIASATVTVIVTAVFKR